MKTPRSTTPKSSASKFSGNPTSTGTTVYECLILVYLALEHLFHNDPRHVEYRKTRKQAKEGILHEERSTTSRSPLTPNAQKTRYNETYPTFPPPASNHSSPRPPRQNTYHSYHVPSEDTSSRINTTIYTAPSKQQMSEAWGRMRATRRRRAELPREAPVGVSGHVHGKRGRNVRWGSVQVNEYEQVRYESPPGRLSGAVGGREVKKNEMNAAGEDSGKVGHIGVEREIWGAVPQAANEQEIWDAVPNEGEIWGSVGPDM